VTNVDVLQGVRNILQAAWCQKDSWLAHIVRHGGFLKNVFEGKMIGKPARGIN